MVIAVVEEAVTEHLTHDGDEALLSRAAAVVLETQKDGCLRVALVVVPVVADGLADLPEGRVRDERVPVSHLWFLEVIRVIPRVNLDALCAGAQRCLVRRRARLAEQLVREEIRVVAG